MSDALLTDKEGDGQEAGQRPHLGLAGVRVVVAAARGGSRYTLKAARP